MDMGKDTVDVVMNVCVYTDVLSGISSVVQWLSSSGTVWESSSSTSRSSQMG